MPRFQPRMSLFALLLVVMGCGGSEELATETEVAGNLELLIRLSREIADSVMTGVNAPAGSPVRISMSPRDHWFVFDAFGAAVEKRGCRLVTGTENRILIDIVVTQAGVEYLRPRRTWLFGTEQVDRLVDLAVRVRVDELGAEEGIHMSSHRGRRTDVVNVSDIPSLETPGVTATRGVAPQGGLLTDLVEPLVIVGAVAVAVVLLFTVRS